MISCLSLNAQNSIQAIALRNGDLLFGHAACGSLCQAIISVTPSYKGIPLSHVGIYAKINNKPMVIEAIGNGVVLTSLDSFFTRMHNMVLVGQPKVAKPIFRKQIVKYALLQIGTPYDVEFLMNNGKYYCSELVYDAYMAANNHIPYFELQPMNYKNKNSDVFNSEWVEYFRNINIEIPEGLPGCNPGALSLAPQLVIYTLLK